jgi:hypothetical protein
MRPGAGCWRIKGRLILGGTSDFCRVRSPDCMGRTKRMLGEDDMAGLLYYANEYRKHAK